jgi:hypothetical protein
MDESHLAYDRAAYALAKSPHMLKKGTNIIKEKRDEKDLHFCRIEM